MKEKTDLEAVERPEQMKLLFEEIRNMQMKINELQEEIEMVSESQDKTQNLIKGGTQPDKQIKIEDKDGGPGSLVVAKIMKKARSGAKHKGISSGEAERLLEDEGYDRSRQSVLNILEKISKKFPGYQLRKGSASKPTALYADK